MQTTAQNLPQLYARVRKAPWVPEYALHARSLEWCASGGPDDPHGGAQLIAIAVVTR